MGDAKSQQRSRTARPTRPAKEAARSGARLPELRLIPLEQIDTPRRPIRRLLGDVASLAESMQQYGLQQPVSLRTAGERFVLTSGLRRFTAAQRLGWTSIPAFVRDITADEAYVVDLVENLQRQDLSPEEEADALGELLRTRGWTLQQVADGIKRSVGYVSKRVRVFEDPSLRQAIVQRGLPVSTAEELLGAAAEQRPLLVERALTERWDQAAAREAVIHADATDSRIVGRSNAASVPDRKTRRGRSRDVVSTHSVQRPRGLTRAIREFHRMMMDIRAEDLTPADRSALRSLFRDLVMLGRAAATSSGPVFPALPTTLVTAGRQPRGRRAARR